MRIPERDLFSIQKPKKNPKVLLPRQMPDDRVTKINLNSQQSVIQRTMVYPKKKNNQDDKRVFNAFVLVELYDCFRLLLLAAAIRFFFL